MEQDPGHGTEDQPSERSPDQARDQAGDDHDRESEARDRRAEARDRRAETRDRAADVRERRAGGSRRTEAAADRAEATMDRIGGARDRRQAALDRRRASADRRRAAEERAASSIDDLTGAYRRDAGFRELERATTRARRTNKPFVLVFVDVDNLKATNDLLGHPAGDELLRHVVDTMRTHLRSYDLIVRYGGDEFVCGLEEITLAAAKDRLSQVNADLRESRQASVAAGFAELRPDDSLGDLIARADEALYQQRQQQGS